MDDAVLREPEFYDIDFESKVTEMDGNGNVVVSESQGQWLPEQEITVLRNHVPDPLGDDVNSRIDLFIKVWEDVKRMRKLPW